MTNRFITFYCSRHCGRILCGKCSDQVVPILKFNLSKPVRVCLLCSQVLSSCIPTPWTELRKCILAAKLLYLIFLNTCRKSPKISSQFSFERSIFFYSFHDHYISINPWGGHPNSASSPLTFADCITRHITCVSSISYRRTLVDRMEKQK